MFTLAQPSYGYYNPYEELAMQQELQRRRQIEAYLCRQREAEEMQQRRREYEAAVRAEYERRREAELERRRQVELQRRRQAQQARGRHSMYDGGLELVFDALYGGRSPRQEQAWQDRQEEEPGVSKRNSPTPTPTPAPNSKPTPVPVSTPTLPTMAEPEPEEPQVDTTPSYATVQSIVSSFATLQSEFTFPTQLDFLPGSSLKLAYTLNNAPLHGYEHALTGLLTQLDAVESYGDDGVRKARKEAVKSIEKELERLDGMKAEAWKRATEPEPEVSELGSAIAEVDVDPLSVPLPEDLDEEDERMEDALEVPVIDQSSGESLAPAESTETDPTKPIALPEVECSTLSFDASSAPVSTSLTPDPEPTHDAAPGARTRDLELLSRSLTSPSPSEASESDSDSDLALEEYVDVETMSASDDEDTNLEEVEKHGNLEMMHDWDLDF
ncbi:unnamed protein product [Rhizoctonia solani]|uniref:BAG domain-containing protein n=1 Tax=Rhizoctonia solani TaxID=456999 RepID=A0A8H3H874_9AGAM|nr:unnamed protein product [Rhizoctonia solani]